MADDGVDDLHERGLDGLLILDEGDRMEAGFGRRANAADHALMKIAEMLAAEGGAAGDSVDLDVAAETSVLVRHGVTTFQIGIGRIFRSIG